MQIQLLCRYPGLGGRGGEGFVGAGPEGRHLSINVCHFLNFHYYSKNWQLTTLWGLLVALKFYAFFEKIIQS